MPTVGREAPATATDLRAPSANNSPSVVAEPGEPRFVVLAHRLDAPEFGCGLQVSGDGGARWAGARPVPTLPEGAERCYAPEAAFDRQGRLYYLFLGLSGPGNRPVGAFLATSDDRGRTFSQPRRVLGPGNYQVRMAIDRERGDRGRIHLVWLHASSDDTVGGLPSGPNPLLAAHSDDGGRTFSPPMQVNDPTGYGPWRRGWSSDLDGAVHVAYYDLRDDVRDYQGLEGPPWDGNWSVVVATSPDGGGRFEPGVVVDDGLVPAGRVMLVLTMAPPALAVAESGEVSVAWSDARNGDADVFASTSDGGRAPFSVARRVNDDPSAPGGPSTCPRWVWRLQVGSTSPSSTAATIRPTCATTSSSPRPRAPTSA